MTCRERARDYVGLSDGISVTVSVPSNKVRVDCRDFSSMVDRLEMGRISCLFHI